MYKVTYTGPHQQKDVKTPDGEKVRLERKQTYERNDKHMDWFKAMEDVAVEDMDELSADMLL